MPPILGTMAGLKRRLSAWDLGTIGFLGADQGLASLHHPIRGSVVVEFADVLLVPGPLPQLSFELVSPLIHS